MNVHKLILTTLATLCAMVGVLVLGGSSALAVSTHAFLSSFGAASSTPANPYPLSKPTGVVVAANGDIYVADPANAWVEKFDSSGHLLLIFGKEVNKTEVEASGTKAAKDVCTIASGNTCKSGVHASTPGAFEEPRFIAVDNSSGLSQGDVYVADTGGLDGHREPLGANLVSKFTAEGGLIESWGNEGQLNDSSVPEGVKGRPVGLDGVTVDPAGNLWIVAANEKEGVSLVDGIEYSESGAFTRYQENFALHAPEGFVGIAVDGSDNLYFSGESSNSVVSFIFGGGPVFGGSVNQSTRQVSGLAVDLSNNDLYVEQHGSLISHFVAPCLTSGCGGMEPNDSFGAGHLSGAVGLVVDPATHNVYAADTGAGQIDVFVPAVLPDVITGSASEGANTTARVSGTVNPDGIALSECAFEYGETESYGETVPCEPSAGQINGNKPVAVQAELKGLKINATTYHFRLLAANAKGAEYGQDHMLITAARPSIEGEAISTATAHSATLSAQINTHQLTTTYDVEYGTSETYNSTSPKLTLQAGPAAVSVPITLESVLQPETTYHFRVVATNTDGTTNGTDMTFTTFADFPGLPDGRGYELVSPVANADGNVYLPGKSGVFEGETSPLPVRASVDGNAVEYVAAPLANGGNGQVGVRGKGNQFVAMRNPGGGWSTVDLVTPGFNRAPFEALFSSELSNSGTGVVAAGSHSLSMSGEGLFDSVGGRSVLVSVLPPVHSGEPGVPVVAATFGGPSLFGAEEGSDFSHVISADGSRVFWTALEGTYNDHLFVRENGSRTVPVSTGAARFWTASTDGQYVFYTEGESLWRFDVESETREELAGEGAGVLGVIGVNETGEDGAYLYFVAKGVLAPGAKPGDDNLYVRHDGITIFVIKLSGDVIHLGGGGETEGVWVADLRSRTAEVAANGHAVVFTRGFAQLGFSEVYVYEADTGRVSCVSCNPSGAPGGQGSLPRSFDGERSTAENDTAGVFLHRWVSGDGKRVFFESGEALVAQDTNGKGDVYEWEQAGSGSCLNAKGCIYLLSGGTSTDNSHLLDASANGNDVFIITRADLTSQDQGETFEVYDARVGALQPPAEPSCTGTGCQGLPSAPPLFATPSSVTFNGVGNFASSSALSAKPKPKAKSVKCRKGFIKRNGRCVKVKDKKARAKRSIHGQGSK